MAAMNTLGRKSEDGRYVECLGCNHLFASWTRLRRHVLYRNNRLKGFLVEDGVRFCKAVKKNGMPCGKHSWELMGGRGMLSHVLARSPSGGCLRHDREGYDKVLLDIEDVGRLRFQEDVVRWFSVHEEGVAH